LKRYLPLLLLVLLSACASTSEQLRVMYADSLRERLDDQFTSLEDEYVLSQEARRETTRKFVEQELLVTAEDYLYTGVILSTSPFEDDLIAASASGLKAAELGDDRGFRVAAESIDRLQMHRGEPQRYGTQYYYVEVIQKWRLYPVDPSTTDGERNAMGIPSLAELTERADTLNEKVR
jgi:hypothetical protein